MVSGERIPTDIGQFAAVSMEIYSWEQIYSAMVGGDTKVMEEILQSAHDTEAPILSYNSEVELSAVVNLCYFSARNKYRVERKDRVRKRIRRFFYPERKMGIALFWN